MKWLQTILKHISRTITAFLTMAECAEQIKKMILPAFSCSVPYFNTYETLFIKMTTSIVLQKNPVVTPAIIEKQVTDSQLQLKEEQFIHQNKCNTENIWFHCLW